MYILKLLVFGIVFSLFTIIIDQSMCWAALKNPSLYESPVSEIRSSLGFCYKIYAGKQSIGFILGVQSSKPEIPRALPSKSPTDSSSLVDSSPFIDSSFIGVPFHTKKQFTHLILDSLNITEFLKSESDSLFSPVYSKYSRYKEGQLQIELTSQFKTTPDTITAQIYKRTEKSSKIIKIPAEFERGLVLASHMTDLLFYKKSATQLKPHQKLIFKTFNESAAHMSEIQTVLDTQSEQIKFHHHHQGESYTTTHTTEGQMIQSSFPNQNIHYKVCKKPDEYLHVAGQNKKFKALFSSQDQEKIKSCCLRF